MESRPAFHFTCVGFSLICLPTQLIAGMVNSPASVDLASSSSEPFGFSTTKVTTGVLLEKWLKIEHEIDAERLVLRNCERNRASCQSRTAIQFLAIIYIGRTLEGRARLGHINRAINLKIKQMSDLAIYGEEDVWSSPLTTLAIGAGDCEDYAIAKLTTFGSSSCATTSGRKITRLSRRGSMVVGSCLTTAAWSWPRTGKRHTTIPYFSSIMMKSNATLTHHRLLWGRVDLNER